MGQEYEMEDESLEIPGTIQASLVSQKAGTIAPFTKCTTCTTKCTLIYTTFSECCICRAKYPSSSSAANGLQQRAADVDGALIAIWGGRILLDTGGSHFELLVVPLR